MPEPRPRKGRPYAPQSFCSRLYLRLDPRHLALLKFLLEGYGHLGILSAVDRHKAVAKLSYSPDSEQEVREFLQEAGKTVPFSLAYRPGAMSGL